MTIQEHEQCVIHDLNELDDWFLQYQYLLELGGTLEALVPEERTDNNRVRGCQSALWLVMNQQNGRIFVRGDSDALIMKGILAVIISLLNGRSCQEILDYSMCFVEQTTLRAQLSTDRFRGIGSVIGRIQEFAAAAAPAVI